MGKIKAMLAFVALTLCGGVWAATPVAVWDGDLDVLNKDGYTLNLNGNTGTKDAITIGSNGIKVTIPGNGFENYMGSIIVQYSGVTAYPSSTKALATFDSNRGQDYTGVCVRNTGDVYGVLTGSDWDSGSNVSSGKIPLTEGSHRLGLVVEMTRSNVKRRGTHACIDGTSVYSVGGLVGSETIVTGFCIGGEDKTTLGSLEGMVIKKIAVFNDALTNDEVTNFKFPSETTYYTATVSSDVTWADLAWNDSKTWGNDNSCDATISVTADAKLTIGAAVTAKKVTFDIAEGKTLTLAASAAITAADNVYVTGTGTIRFDDSTGGFKAVGGSNGTAVKLDLASESTMELYRANTWNYSGCNFTGVSGTGTIKLSGTNWQCIPGVAAIWSLDHPILNTLTTGGMILSAGGNAVYTMANYSGNGDVSTTNGSGARSLTIVQSKDLTWSGTLAADGTARFGTLTVKGTGANKTLTYTGNNASKQAGALTVDASGSMKMNGTWKAKNTVALNGEFGGTGTITDAATISVGVGAKIRADWGVVTLNKAPTVGALVDVVATEIPANNKVKLFAGTSFTQPDGWTTAYARVLVGEAVHYGTVAVEADGVYATISDDARTAAIDAAAKYKYEMNGSFENSASSGVNLTVGGSFAAGDFRESKVLSLGTNVGSHWGSAGFAYGSGAWTIVTTVKAPAANQCVFGVGGAKGVAGMLGLRNAGSNTMKLFTANATDLCSVTLDVDPTAAFHVYTIVYENGTIKMNVDGGEFCAAVPFTPGTGTGWQMGGIVSGGNNNHSVNATSGEMDCFRMYSFPFVKADTKVKASIGDAKFLDLTTALTLAEAGETVTLLAANAETVTIPADVTVDVNGQTFTGAVSGAGKLKVASFAAIKSAAALKNSLQGRDWTGTLVIDGNSNLSSINDGTVGNGYRTTLNDYGHAGSKIELLNCTYAGNGNGNNYFGLTLDNEPTTVVQPELIITGELKLRNGFSQSDNSGAAAYKYRTEFRKLSGTGTILAPRSDLAPLLYFADASEFRGSFNSSGYKFVIGERDAAADAYPAIGSVTIKSGKAMTLAKDANWALSNGVTVDGTLTFEAPDAAATKVYSLALKGAGTLVTKAVSESTQMKYILNNHANFRGSITTEVGAHVMLAPVNTTTTSLGFSNCGFISVQSGAATLADGVTWTGGVKNGNGGVYVAGGTTLNAGAGTVKGKLYMVGNSTLNFTSYEGLTVNGNIEPANATINVTIPNDAPAAELPITLMTWTGSVGNGMNFKLAPNAPYRLELDAANKALKLVDPSFVGEETTPVNNQTTVGYTEIISGSTKILNGAGSATMGALILHDGGTLAYDPVRTPVKLDSVPTIESGATIRLASTWANHADEYATITRGKIRLLTYPNTGSASAAGLTITGLQAGVAYTLEEEAVEDAALNQLVLYIGDYKTKATPIKLSQFGDSITEGIWRDGYIGTPNYRIPLMHRLEAHGYAPTATGFRGDNLKNSGVWGSSDANGVPADPKYRGHNGVSAQRVFSGKTGNSLRAGFVEGIEAYLDASGDGQDIITLKIGTNDLLGGATGDSIFEGWLDIVKRLIKNRPATRIVVTSVIHGIGGGNANLEGAEATAYNAAIANAVATDSELQGHVFLIDARSAVSNASSSYLSDGVHPNWVGHNEMADAWFVGVTNAFAQTTGAAYAPNVKKGVEDNVPAAYRNGFVKLATMDLATLKTDLSAWNGNPYTSVNAALQGQTLTKIAYYVERQTNNSRDNRCVWVDMDPWADAATLANMGVPTTGDGVNKIVSNLHIWSNSTAIDQVAPETEGVKGTLLFTVKGIGGNGGLSDVPASQFGYDWNDSLGSANYGAMVVSRVYPDRPVESDNKHRMALGQTLFSFNGFNNRIENILGIGDFAVHCKQSLGNSDLGSYTLNWISPSDTFTAMHTDNLASGMIEIWGKFAQDEEVEIDVTNGTIATSDESTVEVYKDNARVSTVDDALPTATGIYTILAKRDGDVVAAKEVAVVKVDPVAPTQAGKKATTLVAVPFKGLDGNNVTVEKLINTATLSEGDALKVYQGGYYYHWTLNAQKQWVAGTTVAASEVVKASEPGISSVDLGVAVWVTTADPIVVYGQQTADAGPVVDTGVNLIGNTTLGTIEPAAAIGDEVEIPGDTSGVRTFTKTASGWAGSKIVTETAQVGGKDVTTKREVSTTEPPSVPAGRGYFLKRPAPAR